MGALKGWLFDDVLEKRTLVLIVPRNWRGATDAKLRIFQVPGQAQLAGDDIEWTGEVRDRALPEHRRELEGAARRERGRPGEPDGDHGGCHLMFRSAYFRARHWLARFFGPGAADAVPPPGPPARLGDRGGVRLGAIGGVRLGEHGGVRIGRSRSW